MQIEKCKMQIEKLKSNIERIGFTYRSCDRQVPRKPRLAGGVKGNNYNEVSFPGSPALWAGEFHNFAFCNLQFSFFIAVWPS
jgi:hypothetical protein